MMRSNATDTVQGFHQPVVVRATACVDKSRTWLFWPVEEFSRRL
jgi:hypothetical protein